MSNSAPQTIDSPLLSDLRQLIDGARQRAAVAVNAELSRLYWQVGDRIHRDILGQQRAGHGEQVVETLARHLSAEYGRGWSARHLRLCIRFAQTYPDAEIVHTLCAELSWSHLRLIAALDDALKREFYTELCRLEGWSVRQLQERMQSLLYERSAISRQPEETLRHELQQLRVQGRPSPALLLKDPYLLDFLGLKDRYLEKGLEGAILRDIENVLAGPARTRTRRSTATRDHPLYRQEAGTDRAAGAGPERHPRRRIPHRPAPARAAASPPARRHHPRPRTAARRP